MCYMKQGKIILGRIDIWLPVQTNQRVIFKIRSQDINVTIHVSEYDIKKRQFILHTKYLIYEIHFLD